MLCELGVELQTREFLIGLLEVSTAPPPAFSASGDNASEENE